MELEKFRAQAMLEAENKALALRLKDASVKGDFEAIKELASSDYIYHDATGKEYSLEEMLEGMKRNKTILSDMVMTIEDLIVKRDRIVVRNTNKAAHKGDIECLPATGNRLRVKSS